VACHLYWWHKEPIDAAEWAEEMRGKKHLEALRAKANSIARGIDLGEVEQELEMELTKRGLK